MDQGEQTASLGLAWVTPSIAGWDLAGRGYSGAVLGWVDFDPTNTIVGNRNLIRVAVAWDPQQALPLWGSFIGSTSSFRGMEVEVNVTEENRDESA